MSNFEERLLTALKQELATRETVVPLRRNTGRRVAGWSAAVAGVAAATLFAFNLYGGASAAYAVTEDPDGTVKVQVNELSDPEGLEAALQAKGIAAVVDFLPEGRTCKAPRGRASGPDGRLAVGMSAGSGGFTFEVTEGQIGENQTLVLTLSGVGASVFGSQLEIVEGPVAACEEVDMPKPSGGPARDGDGGPALNVEPEGSGPKETILKESGGQ
ncbi:hypothetical protein [Nonomuraea soli]|uniref:Uncharacterized protein n=1 Tax=Nonomuraea soli TaxID=1032476 RepID=A0A7W0CHD8_9ACTN|nr:hypothetical protein [Nonomuraea soli]MBA2891231.1 hypothetical protein [Nonomuraea soli]